jgi:hypothetical protein
MTYLMFEDLTNLKNMKCNGVLTKCEELDLDNEYFLPLYRYK